MVSILQAVGGLFLLFLLWLLMLAFYLVTRIIKLFVWVPMLFGVTPAKAILLWKLQRVHSRLEEMYDGYGYQPSEAEGDLLKKLSSLQKECRQLKIAQWRRNTAHWLAVY